MFTHRVCISVTEFHKSDNYNNKYRSSRKNEKIKFTFFHK